MALGIFFSGCDGRTHTTADHFTAAIQMDMSQGGAAFIEPHDPNSDAPESSFGDVVAIDFATNTKHYITRDEFPDDYPAISPDGRFIAFSSARIGRPGLLKVVGEGAPKELLVFDLQTGLTRNVDNALIRTGRTTAGAYCSPTWSADGSVIYFTHLTNTIYGIAVSGDSLWQVAALPDTAECIHQVRLSPDGKQIACAYWILEPFVAGISIVDLVSGRWDILYSGNKGRGLGGWSHNQEVLFVSRVGSTDSTIMAYDLSRGKQLSAIPIHADDSLGKFEGDLSVADGDFFFIAAHKRPSKDGSKSIWGSDIARYHHDTQRLEWLTNDGTNKYSLNVFMPAKRK
jgi:WD40 repeat protein